MHPPDPFLDSNAPTVVATPVQAADAQSPNTAAGGSNSTANWVRLAIGCVFLLGLIFYVKHGLTRNLSIETTPPGATVFINGRLALVHSPEGLNDAHSAKGCCCCGGAEISEARQVNVNAVAYALLH